MARFIPQSTQLAEWQALVDEASLQAGYHFDNNVEHYLVLTLDHFTTEKSLANVTMAIDFLLAFEKLGRQGGELLRQVGDKCLLLTGLFPERALRKNVSLEYFIGIGQQAYHILADFRFKQIYDNELFDKLSKDFVELIHVLQAMRQFENRKKLLH